MGFTIWLSLVHLTILSPGGGTDCTVHPNQMKPRRISLKKWSYCSQRRALPRDCTLTHVHCHPVRCFSDHHGWLRRHRHFKSKGMTRYPPYPPGRPGPEPQDWVVHLNTTPVLRAHTASIQHVFAKCLLHDRHRVRSWIMNYFHFISKDNWVYGEPSDIF